MPSRLLILYYIAGVYGKDLSFYSWENDYEYNNNLEVQSIRKDVEPTKNGPVLFPNDGPPPPKTPLIVTSRPLSESIARSELNPESNRPLSNSRARNGLGPENYIAREGQNPENPDYIVRKGLNPENPEYIARKGLNPENPEYIARNGLKPENPEYIARKGLNPENPDYSDIARNGLKPENPDFIARKGLNTENPFLVTARRLIETISRDSKNGLSTPEYFYRGHINNLRYLKKNQPKIGLVHARKFKDPHVHENLGEPFYQGSDGRQNNEQSQIVLLNHIDPYRGKPLYDFDQRAPEAKVSADGRNEKSDDLEFQIRVPARYKALGRYPLKAPRFSKVKKEKVQKVHNDDEENNIHHEDDENANYAFSYKVKDKKTGDDYSHMQRSSGSATNGEYRVLLPDGRMQIVSYTADENGYKADVRYDKAHGRYDKVDKPNKSRLTTEQYQERFLDYNQAHNEDYPNPTYTQVPNVDLANNKDTSTTSTNDVRAEKVDDSLFNYPDPEREYYTKPKKESLQYDADEIDEYYVIDYGDEEEYEVHKGKFGRLYKNPYLNVINVMKRPLLTTVSPLIQGLRGILSGIEHNVPSTTANPFQDTTKHDAEDENVVHIGGKKLYTNSLPFIYKQDPKQVPTKLTEQQGPTTKPNAASLRSNLPYNNNIFSTTSGPKHYDPFYVFPTTETQGTTYHNPYYVFTNSKALTQINHDPFHFPKTNSSVPTSTPYYIFPTQQSYTTINPHRTVPTTESRKNVPTKGQLFPRFQITTERNQRYQSETPQSQIVSTTLIPKPTTQSIFSSSKPVFTDSFIDKINQYLTF